MEKIFYVGAVKLFARLYGWERVEIYPDRVAVGAGRERAGKAAGAGSRHPRAGNDRRHELRAGILSLDGFMALGKNLVGCSFKRIWSRPVTSDADRSPGFLPAGRFSGSPDARESPPCLSRSGRR